MHIQEILGAIYANHLYEYLVIDSDHKVIEYSDKVFELCQKDAIDCNQSKLTDIVPELLGIEPEIAQIFQGEKETFTLPYVFKNPNQYVHIHLHPGRKSQVNDDRAYETLIVLFENITKMVEVQQNLVQEHNEKSLLLDEISQKNMQLKRFNEEMQLLVEREIEKNLEKQKLLELKSRHIQMGEMIAMITHQWKQPLNVINLVVNVLKINLKKKTLSKKDTEKKLNDILKQVKYMTQTVNDFQNFFNPFKEKIIFNISESIRAVLDLVKYEYVHKNIDIQLTGNTKLMAYGYPNEFNQVILSLLKNAKDAFMEHPHEAMKIIIEIIEEDGISTVIITDNAGGIPEELIGEIFNLYVTTKQEGSGLGLNIAKSMIEKNMQGKIDVKNVEGGAQFTITLPTPPATL